MKFVGLAILSVGLLTLCSCYSAPVMPPSGWVYSEIAAPMDVDANNTDMGARTGESESMSILGLVALGDCSVEAAAKKGGIKTVKHLDYKYTNILGIYQKFVTVAKGD